MLSLINSLIIFHLHLFVTQNKVNPYVMAAYSSTYFH